MNREENLDLNIAPTLFIEFHGITTGQLSEVLEMAEEICRAGRMPGIQAGAWQGGKESHFQSPPRPGRNHHAQSSGLPVLLSTDVAVPNTQYPELIKTIHA